MENTQTINCTGDKGCECEACERARTDAWLAGTKARWAKAYAEGRVAHLCGNPCRNPLCPKHGDPRDTSILPLVLR